MGTKEPINKNIFSKKKLKSFSWYSIIYFNEKDGEMFVERKSELVMIKRVEISGHPLKVGAYAKRKQSNSMSTGIIPLLHKPPFFCKIMVDLCGF
jgi:uncharacterized protein YlbG (UPF0298 family)